MVNFEIISKGDRITAIFETEEPIRLRFNTIKLFEDELHEVCYTPGDNTLVELSGKFSLIAHNPGIFTWDVTYPLSIDFVNLMYYFMTNDFNVIINSEDGKFSASHFPTSSIEIDLEIDESYIIFKREIEGLSDDSKESNIYTELPYEERYKLVKSLRKDIINIPDIPSIFSFKKFTISYPPLDIGSVLSPEAEGMIRLLFKDRTDKRRDKLLLQLIDTIPDKLWTKNGIVLLDRLVLDMNLMDIKGEFNIKNTYILYIIALSILDIIKPQAFSIRTKGKVEDGKVICEHIYEISKIEEGEKL